MIQSGDSEKKAWVVAIDMGYGHQRTAHPLRDIAFGGKLINANHYKGIPKKDHRVWQATRSSYEFISRLRRMPLVGDKVFSMLDNFQKILGYYPKRDLSKSNLSGKIIFRYIKKGWGRDLIERLKQYPLPLVTTFFTPAFMAEELNYPNDIYCVVCDADIARPWVSLNPQKSRIKYFVPCSWSRDRLKLYGVKPENIFLTGYPLPKENIGGEHLAVLKRDLGYRIVNLDPTGNYRTMYRPLIKGYLGQLPSLPSHPLTLMFSIGGAGAQKEIGVQLANSLREKIIQKQLRLIISVGTRKALKRYFEHHLKGLKVDGWVAVLSGDNAGEYFQKFNQALRTTDILWTKPSELSFYAALGLPIIIAPTLGSQEDFNKRWILHHGAGMDQENPSYANEWLFDMLNSGDLAEMAMQGFVEMRVAGTYNIEKVINGQPVDFSDKPLSAYLSKTL